MYVLSVELDGRFGPRYRHSMMGLLTHSYSEVGAFPHSYHLMEEDDILEPCPSQIRTTVAALDFDNKGKYLASVTRAGCLTIHDFEALYCNTQRLPRLKEDEEKHLLHLPLERRLDVIKWNPLDQDEIVYASGRYSDLCILNVPHGASQMYRTDGRYIGVEYKGFSDVAFASNGPWIFASDTLANAYRNMIYIWDTRVGSLPCCRLTSANRRDNTTIRSIQVDATNQVVFGGGENGRVYLWDVRGGTTDVVAQNNRIPCLMSVDLGPRLPQETDCKEVIDNEIDSICLNPSCPYQLAFHLSSNWSGILDTNQYAVTHLHCPPPISVEYDISNLNVYKRLSTYPESVISYPKKSTWLSTWSIFLAPYCNGIYLLDFYPSTSSACHVEYNQNNRNNPNRYIGLSQGVISCAAHPLYNAIVAGTQESSLLVISQRRQSLGQVEEL